MSDHLRTGFVVKLLYDNAGLNPRWVMADSGRSLGAREHATVFPDRQAAESEAKLWKALTTTAFAVVVEPV